VLENLLGRAINTTPERTVLTFHRQSWTAAQLDAEACCIAANLGKSGLESMDRVAVLLPNSPETVFTYLAWLVDEMPLKGAGKIDRDRLKWRAETGLDEL
jgi:acyl-CoA synthetase (AMP-forming)/AMP-acid ligase II